MQLIHGEYCLLPLIRLFNKVSEHWNWSIWNTSLSTLSSVPRKLPSAISCCHLLTKHRSEKRSGNCTSKTHALGHKLNNSHKKIPDSLSRALIIVVILWPARALWTSHCHKAAVFTCRGCLLPEVLGPSSGWDWSLRAAVGCNLEKTSIINNQVFQKPSLQLINIYNTQYNYIITILVLSIYDSVHDFRS